MFLSRAPRRRSICSLCSSRSHGSSGLSLQSRCSSRASLSGSSSTAHSRAAFRTISSWVSTKASGIVGRVSRRRSRRTSCRFRRGCSLWGGLGSLSLSSPRTRRS
eukprot:Amastigsp_a4574_54.p5 type:complete len:105 gc:universal Amastigsp_a4574_54:432-746(+)